MAEEVVVKEGLAPEKIRAGAELTRQLDEQGHSPRASLWFYLPEANEWRLLLALPELPEDGPKDAYRYVNDALTRLGEAQAVLSLREVSVVEPEHPIIQLLRSAIQTGGGISGVRFSRNVINGQFIDDAYIYRLQ